MFDGGTSTLIDLATGADRQLPGAAGDKAPWDAEFSPDGRFLLAFHLSGQIDVWLLDNDAKKLDFPLQLRFSNRPVFSPDAKQFAMVTAYERNKKQSLLIVDIESAKVVRTLCDYEGVLREPERFFYSPDGKQLVAQRPKWDADGRQCEFIQRWDVATGKELPAIELTGCGYAEFSPDGRILAIACGKVLRLHDAGSTQEIRRFPITTHADEYGRMGNFGHGMGGPFAFSPDGKKLAVAAGRAIRQFDVASGQEIGPTPNWHTVVAVSVAKKGELVASLAQREVQLWSTAESKMVFHVEPWLDADKQEVALTAATISADARDLAVGGSDGAITIFDIPSGKPLKQLRSHSAPVIGLVFLPDSDTLVSSDINANIAHWQCGSGELHPPTVITNCR